MIGRIIYCTKSIDLGTMDGSIPTTTTTWLELDFNLFGTVKTTI